MQMHVGNLHQRLLPPYLTLPTHDSWVYKRVYQFWRFRAEPCFTFSDVHPVASYLYAGERVR